MNDSQSPYWIGKRPTNAKKWSGAKHAQIISDDRTIEAVFHIYQRFVKQWNDVELDAARNFDESPQEIAGAKITSDPKRFIIHGRTEAESMWILEVWYARGFRSSRPGLSCARNTMRSITDIKSLHLHFSPGGPQAFEDWLQHENQTWIGNLNR